MRRAFALLLLLLAPALGANLLPAQTITVQNLAPTARQEGCCAVVPFAKGAVRELPDLHVDGRATVWVPFGARWPDGSLRQARCLFRAELQAFGELELALKPGPGPALPPTEIQPPDVAVEFVLQRGDRTFRAQPAFVELLEDNALRRVGRFRTRVQDSGLIAEVLVTTWRDQPHAQLAVAVFFSDPSTPAMECAIGELRMECRGMTIAMYDEKRFAIGTQADAGGSRTVLLRNTVLGDGQGIRRTGVLVPLHCTAAERATLQAAVVCPLLAATTWRDSGAFGAFGVVPEPPAWLQGGNLRAMLAQRHRNHAAAGNRDGDPFAAPPFGLAKAAGQTGDQNDFGVVKLSLVAHSGLPSLLLEMTPSVLQEACRPVHCFETDATPVLASNHPRRVVWSGRTHWHEPTSPDRLGKPAPEPRFERHGWSGKDREHWSSNHLGAYALLTGEHWAIDELRVETQLYLGGQTVAPGVSTSGAGAPRGGGRTELAACWMYLATGDEALLQRMRDRMRLVYHPQWFGRGLPDGKVRPMHVAEPDARMLQGKTRYWTPWQDAMAAVGFAALHRVTGEPLARELADELALNVVRHGYLFDGKQCLIATAMRWQDGEPLSAAQLTDAGNVLWSHGTAFTEWSIGACTLAEQAATARGEQATAARAAAIAAHLRAGRKRPADGFVDRLTEWDAVVR